MSAFIRAWGTIARCIVPFLSIGLLFIPAPAAKAQNIALVIKPGTTVGLSGNALVLTNTDLYNNGTLNAPAGTVWLTGTNNTSYNGTGTGIFRKLQLSTGPSTVFSLNNWFGVTGSLTFQQGLIDLHNQQLQLKSSATLQGESETSRITGVNGGSVTAFSSGLFAPNQVNIGNLGAVISSSANLGSVSIMRLHKPATNTGNPSDHGIDRAYLIQPGNDAGLNATLRFNYLNAELDGNDPSTLSLWRSNDGVHWVKVGFDTRNTLQKYVEKQGLATLSWWTLSSAANPLPLSQTTFKVSCEGPVAVVQWETGEERNLDYFLVQRMTDGGEWTTLHMLAATNNPIGSSYVFKDNQPADASYYRIGIVDRLGTIGFSPAFSGGCADIALPLMVYPNPAESQTVAQVSVRQAKTGSVLVLDINGRPVYQAKWGLQPGINQLILPLYGLAAGSYVVRLSLPGAPIQQVQLLKK